MFSGTAGSLNNQLNLPYGFARDLSSGTRYIADYSNHRIMSYLPGSTNGTVIAGGNGSGTSSTQLMNPIGLCFDSSSNSLLIANYGAHNIVRWVLGATSWTLVAGITGSAGSTSTQLNSPMDVTLDSMGNIYVADSSNHRIQFFLAGQSNGTTIAGITAVGGSTSTQLNSPSSVIVDTQFNLYVSDFANHRVQKFLFY
ncbi:unnamed protein product [Rotaria sordida]|uniref:NHL repeat-containing protein n=1 Tax=Rotaria sordida TaxID=392033 RepID=A0A814Y554_9BILA|nr:unnamed protein product [Rotaria sordida]CAF1195429.1 unnamed protein product [Rotaria sordida]CAF1224552.1 unnamed protein product [Rotaria sordida]CAF1505027.1 unnamed protein product [Rotaria sordida]